MPPCHHIKLHMIATRAVGAAEWELEPIVPLVARVGTMKVMGTKIT
jgi:hypothetical protein